MIDMELGPWGMNPSRGTQSSVIGLEHTVFEIGRQVLPDYVAPASTNCTMLKPERPLPAGLGKGRMCNPKAEAELR